jgi:hypothetical protein
MLLDVFYIQTVCYHIARLLPTVIRAFTTVNRVYERYNHNAIK